jgi:hypothetical protein
MAFKMRSGNKSSFKNMGSSPAKETEAKKSSIDLAGKLDIDDTSIGRRMEYYLTLISGNASARQSKC